jgi:type IV pilus assembly protein PilM
MLSFLNLKPEIFGLNINDESIKIVKLENNKLACFNNLKLNLGIIEKGIIKDEKALVEAIKTACKTVKGKKLKTKYVAVSLPEEKSFLQVIQMPKMKEEELAVAVPLESENYIPLPINQVYLDFKTISNQKDHPEQLEVLMVAFEKTTVDSYVSCIKKAGLIPAGMEVESLASARALIKNETSSYPLALIDIGQNDITLSVFSGNSICFTSSIEKSSPDDLILQIKKYLDFYKDHAPIKTNQEMKAIIFGEGSYTTGLTELIYEKLKIKPADADVCVNILSKKEERRFADFYKSSRVYATAMGLALRETKTDD